MVLMSIISLLFVVCSTSTLTSRCLSAIKKGGAAEAASAATALGEQPGLQVTRKQHVADSLDISTVFNCLEDVCAVQAIALCLLKAWWVAYAVSRIPVGTTTCKHARDWTEQGSVNQPATAGTLLSHADLNRADRLDAPGAYRPPSTASTAMQH